MTNVEISLDEIQIYCGTYRKYNEGSLYGKWLKLSDYSDYSELYSAMRKLHKDESDPEFMFQDYEAPSFLEKTGLISESYLSSKIYEVIAEIKDSGYSTEVWEAFFDCFGHYTEIEEISERIKESYQGEYDSDEDFAEQLLAETASIPDDFPRYIYIDWERTARDIMFDYSASGGRYFKNY